VRNLSAAIGVHIDEFAGKVSIAVPTEETYNHQFDGGQVHLLPVALEVVSYSRAHSSTLLPTAALNRAVPDPYHG